MGALPNSLLNGMTKKLGRPTKYDDSMPSKVNDYLEMAGREQQHLPKVESFAIYIGVNEDTVNEWRKVHPEFDDAIKLLKMKQKEQLIDDGIYGGKEVNATIVKLLLQNNHGMKERTDQTTDDKPLPAPIYGGKSTV